MPAYTVTGIQKADFPADRSQFEIELRTETGALTLSVSADHLDAFVTVLEGLQYHASLLDPAAGQRPSELAQVRARIVNHQEIGRAVINGVPSVLLGLKSGQPFQWYALDSDKAETLRQALTDQIPKLRDLSSPSSH